VPTVASQERVEIMKLGYPHFQKRKIDEFEISFGLECP
jgi:hypothetical protein